MVFSTLVTHGLVVNARNDYLSSSFHHALLDESGKYHVELLNVGTGHAVEEAELVVPCNQRDTLPHLTFKEGKGKAFASFDGMELFPTTLTSGDVKKLRKANKQLKKKKIWQKKTKWCSTSDFIKFRQTGEDEREVWQLGLGFMKKYVVEYHMIGSQGVMDNRIGIAPSKGVEIKLPKGRVKRVDDKNHYKKTPQ